MCSLNCLVRSAGPLGFTLPVILHTTRYQDGKKKEKKFKVDDNPQLLLPLPVVIGIKSSPHLSNGSTLLPSEQFHPSKVGIQLSTCIRNAAKVELPRVEVPKGVCRCYITIPLSVPCHPLYIPHFPLSNP